VTPDVIEASAGVELVADTVRSRALRAPFPPDAVPWVPEVFSIESAAVLLLDQLSDPEYFAQVSVDQGAGTVTLPNGLDLAPEVLHGDFETEHPLGFHDVTPAH
jgi:hypothetical protein